MNNNYEIVQTISENVFQRLMKCRGENGEIFYNNVITGSGLMKLIDTDKLKRLPTNIIECYRTGDRIYIMTEEMDLNSLRDYAAEGKLTFRQQFALSRAVMELADDIYGMSDVVQQKILDFDNLKVDKDGNICINCTFEFEQDYDISENETFKRLSNIIHYIFAGIEIVDYNISDSIPPDVLKIVVRCLTKEYMHPRDALNELIKSPIYNMMNLDISTRITDEEKPEEKALRNSIGRYTDDKEPAIKEEPSLGEPSDDESNVLNIYIDSPVLESVKELAPAKKETFDEGVSRVSARFSDMDLRKKGFIGIVALGVALMLFFAVRGLLVKDSDHVSGKPGDDNNSIATNTTGQAIDKNVGTDDVQDTTTKYFNDNLLQVIQYNGVKAMIYH